LGRVPNEDAILDLADVTFCSSALLGCLLRLQQRLVGGGHRIGLSGMSPIVRRLLDVTSTIGLFPMMITDPAGATEPDRPVPGRS
jgi:anti-anti-sigma factor